MESKLIQLARQAVMAASQRLDTQERVSAFLAHSRMVAVFYQAGRQLRLTSQRR